MRCCYLIRGSGRWPLWDRPCHVCPWRQRMREVLRRPSPRDDEG